MDWTKLQAVYELARKKAVGFSLVYEEASDEWYGVVSSAAPAEETVTKSGTFGGTIARLTEWMEKL